MFIKRNKTLEADKLIKCAVCDNPVLVFSVGDFTNVPCKKCGWKQNKDALESPNKVRFMNFVSIEKAKKLYKAGKPLTPDFEDFVDMFLNYGEVEFTYKGTRYGLTKSDGTIIELFIVGRPEAQEFNTIEEFIAKANINGALLKDIWDKVKNANWLQ